MPSDDKAPAPIVSETVDTVPDNSSGTDNSRQLRSLGSQEISEELLRRASDQMSRLEVMDTIFKEMESNQGIVIYLEILDLVDQMQKLHEKFQGEHSYLIAQWPPSKFDHDYFKTDHLKMEETLYRKTMKLLRHNQQLLTPAGNSAANSTIQVVSQIKPARLPEISIPKFDGDYLKWPEYKAIVKDLVLNRTDISNTAKFHHLKGSLRGSAAAIVTHLNPSEEALDSAWHLLVDRFENKRLIVNSHLERLYNLSPLKTRSSSNVNKIINTVNETLESLKVLQKGNISECLLTYHVTTLLDEDTRERWENSIGSSTEYPAISKLIEFLSTRARTLEGLENSATHPQKNPTQEKRTFQPPMRAHAHSANSHRAEPQPGGLVWTCDACNGGHYIATCQIFRDMSVDHRVRVVRDKVLCIYCLGRHSARNCRSTNKRCRTCSIEHHTLLHGGNISQVFPRTTQTDQGNSQQFRNSQSTHNLHSNQE